MRVFVKDYELCIELKIMRRNFVASARKQRRDDDLKMKEGWADLDPLWWSEQTWKLTSRVARR